MATVITATSDYESDSRFKLFLGGAIDMGQAQNWRSRVIQSLDIFQNIVILNPRKENFTPDMLDKQIDWELKALEDASLIMMWFPAASKAPISLLETGLYMRSGKLLLGAENGYYRRQNLKITSRRYNVNLLSTLDQMIDRIICLVQDKK